MKSKQTLKYKYTRKQWLKKYYELPDNSIINNLLKDLLVIKQEDKKECDNPGEEKQQIKIYCRECGKPMFIDFDSGVNLCNTCYERGLNPKSPSLLNDIETIEEIESIPPITSFATDEEFYWLKGVEENTNLLIKNQRILTETIKKTMEVNKPINTYEKPETPEEIEMRYKYHHVGVGHNKDTCEICKKFHDTYPHY